MAPEERGAGVPAAHHRNRLRASSFGDNAELYDRTRPSYPAALLDELAAPAPRGVVDVGCGTGILGQALAERGLAVLGVEPDERMAAVARSKGLKVEVSTFESWDPGARTFELVASGQAWHWVDPVVGAERAAAVLAPGGLLALAWNDARMEAPMADALDSVYAQLAPPGVAPVVRHRREEWLAPGGSESAITANESFGDVEVRTFPWERHYSTAEWVAQLETHSDHRAMDDAARAVLLEAVGAAIDAHGGSFSMRYDCRCTRAQRR